MVQMLASLDAFNGGTGRLSSVSGAARMSASKENHVMTCLWICPGAIAGSSAKMRPRIFGLALRSSEFFGLSVWAWKSLCRGLQPSALASLWHYILTQTCRVSWKQVDVRAFVAIACLELQIISKEETIATASSDISVVPRCSLRSAIERACCHTRGREELTFGHLAGRLWA